MRHGTLALLALLAFALSGGVALAAGNCGSQTVDTGKQTVATAEGGGSTQIAVPEPKGG